MKTTDDTPDYRNMVLRMVANFPGLYTLQDDEEVDGADLVEWITNEIFQAAQLDEEIIKRARYGSPDDDEVTT